MIINGVLFEADLQDILDELVRQLRINDIPYLQKMKESGGDIMVTCPYHNNGMERRPSAGIKKSDGTFHCLACHETHSLQEVIAYCFGYTNDMIGAFGWKWLVKNFATVEVEERADVKLNLERNKDYRKYRGINNSTDSSIMSDNAIDISDKVNNQYVTEEELDSYRYYHPYMYKRKLTDEVIELFDIGYDKDTQCITFPIRDIKGNCLFVARRSVNTKFFNYPQGVKKPLYGLYELSRLEKFPSEVYICESMLDALTIWCYNKYAVALNGLGNDLSISQIKKLPCRRVILATDKDDAGKKARIRLRHELNNKIVTELDYRTYPDHAKDMNDMTREEFYALREVF